MSMTMLQIIQAATAELGLASPVYVAGNTASDTVQQLALLNGVGRKLQRDYDWQDLIKTNVITTAFITMTGDIVAGSPTISNLSTTATIDASYSVLGTGIPTSANITAVLNATTANVSFNATATGNYSFDFCKTRYAMPSDYDRMIDRTQWDKTKHWEMMGPETAQEWQWLRSGYIATGPRIRFRLLRNLFQTWPPIAAQEVLSFEFVSTLWSTSINAGSFTSIQQPDKASFTVDTDKCIWPDELMISGFKAAYFSIKGFDATELKASFGRELSIAKANDGGSRTLSFAPGYPDVLITPANIQDSGYGV